MPLDTTTQLYGYSALTIALVALFIVFVLYFWSKKLGIGTGIRQWGMLLFGIVGVVALLAMSGLSLLGTTEVAPGATYDITMSEAQAHVTVNNNDLVIGVQCSFNYTGDGTFLNGTGSFEVNFTLDRTDSGTKADTTTLEVSDVGSVADDAASRVYTLVSKGTTYQVVWTKAINPSAATITTVSKTGLSLTLHVDAGGANWALCNVTLNADAVDAMVPYTVETVYFSLAGHTVVANIQVTSYAGVAPS